MMKAGEYYVGDLCYVMTDEWSEVCDKSVSVGHEGYVTLADGRELAIYSTKHGDGIYSDNKNNLSYSVDSGTIGCILVKDIDQSNPDNILRLGVVHNFTKDFMTFTDEHGTLYFGDLEVYTGEIGDADSFYDEDEEEYN